MSNEHVVRLCAVGSCKLEFFVFCLFFLVQSAALQHSAAAKRWLSDSGSPAQGLVLYWQCDALSTDLWDVPDLAWLRLDGGSGGGRGLLAARGRQEADGHIDAHALLTPAQKRRLQNTEDARA